MRRASIAANRPSPGGGRPSPGRSVTWVIPRGGIRGHPRGCDNRGMAEIDDAVRAPGWLRDLGLSSWLIVGVVLVLVGIVWVLGAASTIVGPMLLALVIATVASPVVAAIHRSGLGRGW